MLRNINELGEPVKIRIQSDQRFIIFVLTSIAVAVSLSIALFGSNISAASAPPRDDPPDFPDTIRLFPDSANPPVFVWHTDDPSKRQTSVRFSVTNNRAIERGTVALEIFGLNDPYRYYPPIKIITRIQPFPASGIEMEWDGTDDAGNVMEEGIYPYDIKAYVLGAIALPDGSTPPPCGKSDEKNSRWLEVGPPADDYGNPADQMDSVGYDDNSTPEDETDDSRIYHISYGLKEPERNASSGMVKLYDPDYEVVWERSIPMMPSAIEGDNSTGLEASPLGRQHLRVARVPVSAMEKIGEYRFVVFAQDSRADLYCSNTNRPAQEKGGMAQPVVKDIAAGNLHSLFLLSDGTVFACGQNSEGQLGIGNKNDQTRPVKALIPRDEIVEEIAAGGAHSLARTKKGNIYAWGSDLWGQLGINKPKPEQDKPVKIPGVEGAVRIAAGGAISMAVIGTNRELYTWGNVYKIQINPKPMKTTLKGVTDIKAGAVHCLALIGGQLYAWGGNGEGQLGLGGFQSQETPQKVPGFSSVTKIAAGGFHSLAVYEKKVFAWGNNKSFQLGLNLRRIDVETKPRQVGGGDFVDVWAGGKHRRALTSDKEVYVWGEDLGLGLGEDDVSRNTPTKNPNLSKIKKVSGGLGYTLALDEDGKVFAFGPNNLGQLGVGDEKPRPKPVMIPPFK